MGFAEYISPPLVFYSLRMVQCESRFFPHWNFYKKWWTEFMMGFWQNANVACMGYYFEELTEGNSFKKT